MGRGGGGPFKRKGTHKFCDLYVHGIDVHWNWNMVGGRGQITGDTRSIAPKKGRREDGATEEEAVIARS